jgi:ABC-type multidrug transport system permease subunit
VRAAWAIARNDLRVWRRSPAAIAAALVPPLLMAVLIAVLTASVTQQPVALVAQDHGPLATRFAHIVAEDSEAYALHVTDAQTAARELDAQQVAAVLTIPPDFDARVAEDRALVQLTLNNVDSDFSDDIRRTVERSVAQFDAPQLGFLGEHNGAAQGLLLPNVYRVTVAEHDMRRTTVDFLHYNLVPVLVLLVINAGMLGTALLLAHDRERGTGKAMVLMPVSPVQMLIGRLLGGALAASAILAPAVVVATALGVLQPQVTHWPAVAAVLALCTAVAVGLGTLLAALLRHARVVPLAAVTLATYLFLLGGGFTTLVFLPGWVQALSRAVPTSYAIDALRQALFYPQLAGVARDLLSLGVAAALLLALGMVASGRTWRAAR